MQPTQNHNDFSEFISRFIPVIGVIVGGMLKVGRDLIRKRKMTIYQRIGVFLITIGFGCMGWWVCLAIGWKMNDWRVPITISVAALMGEDIMDWIQQNKERIFEFIAVILTKKK